MIMRLHDEIFGERHECGGAFHVFFGICALSPLSLSLSGYSVEMGFLWVS